MRRQEVHSWIETDSTSIGEVLNFIERANDLEIHEIMQAVRRRFAAAYPDWDVFYAAVHKDPALRRKELEELAAYIEKDLRWHEDSQKKGSANE